MAFLDENYLLTNTTGKIIFQNIKDLPILDAHNHANIKEIADNKNYTDIWQVEAASDHYVWELMRKRGVSEEFITGSKSNEEKWTALAGIFEDLVGNPLYEWIHLDLQRRFGIMKLINKTNAKAIWDQTKAILQQVDKKPFDFLKEMHVEVMCTTDDPLDTLEFHQQLHDIRSKAKIPLILPTWRPDKAMNIFKADFHDYIKKLGTRFNCEIITIAELCKALQQSHEHFEKLGCRASDHGVMIPFGYNIMESEANKVFIKRMKGDMPTPKECESYMSFIFNYFGELNAKSGWVTQIHIGAVRDVRDTLFNSLGPDTGGDVSNYLIEIVAPLKDFLNRFDNRLKVVLYSMDPTHWPTLATLTRAFGAKINLGTAWWFNDSPIGMQRQLEYIGTVDLLMNFAGMVTDSRKLMSYGSRTEMFRRVCANSLGLMVEKGQIPEELAIRLAKYICYEGPKKFFSF